MTRTARLDYTANGKTDRHAHRTSYAARQTARRRRRFHCSRHKHCVWPPRDEQIRLTLTIRVHRHSMEHAFRVRFGRFVGWRCAACHAGWGRLGGPCVRFRWQYDGIRLYNREKLSPLFGRRVLPADT